MAQQDDQTFRVKVGPVENPLALEVHPAAGDLRPWDNESRLQRVKGRHPRLEAPLKVTGRATYTYDVQVPGMLWAKMVRAPIPAGKIVRIDTTKAEQLKGVRAVWTTDAKLVRFAGQDIAAVAAVSQEIAEDAARLVEVRYEATPFVTDLEEAMGPNAPLVFAEVQAPAPPITPRKGNVTGPLPPAAAGGARGGSRGDVQKGFAEADTVHEATYRLAVHTHSVLETHGIVARWEGDRLTVYTSTQGVFMVRAALAEIFGLPRNKVRVITEHMGGGFGSKLSPSAVGSAFAIIACRLARKTGAPVKLMLDRHEEQLCTGNAPGALSTVRLGAKRDGTLTSIHYRAYTEGGVGQSARTGAPAGSMYAECPNVLLEEYDVLTNAGPTCALRAPGHPQGAFGLECAMDELAHRLGMDPLELRRKNDSHPFRRAYYDVGAKAIGWERRNRVPGETPGPRKRGIGMAHGNWYVIFREAVAVEVQVHRDGSVELFHGAQDLGTGIRTALAVIAAEELGLRPADITVHVGDTRFPPGGTSGGSTTTNSSGPAARLAAHDARSRIARLAAPLLQAKPEELTFSDGKILVAANPDRQVSFREAAQKMPGEVIACLADRKRQFEAVRQDLAATQFAEVEVDVETGLIRILKMVGVSNCGTPINLLTAENQLIGAQIQGASWALLEHRTLDRNVGTMVNPNLEAYKLLGPADMFETVPIFTEGANAGNNTSATGLAEPVFVPTLAAIANAVHNATGVRLRALPMTPDRVLAALAEGRKGGKS
ncbi:MAG TPA: xanthine dehydrogenase family protein molybdopterin-binding subunit [Candidatus Methylomirabilis sp.]|nr:xanthine dehydrogenase family protein molybdopterin-binding subunit [Candidatus Methylomirabilis sp.]